MAPSLDRSVSLSPSAVVANSTVIDILLWHLAGTNSDAAGANSRFVAAAAAVSVGVAALVAFVLVLGGLAYLFGRRNRRSSDIIRRPQRLYTPPMPPPLRRRSLREPMPRLATLEDAESGNVAAAVTMEEEPESESRHDLEGNPSFGSEVIASQAEAGGVDRGERLVEEGLDVTASADHLQLWLPVQASHCLDHDGSTTSVTVVGVEPQVSEHSAAGPHAGCDDGTASHETVGGATTQHTHVHVPVPVQETEPRLNEEETEVQPCLNGEETEVQPCLNGEEESPTAIPSGETAGDLHFSKSADTSTTKSVEEEPTPCHAPAAVKQMPCTLDRVKDDEREWSTAPIKLTGSIEPTYINFEADLKRHKRRFKDSDNMTKGHFVAKQQHCKKDAGKKSPEVTQWCSNVTKPISLADNFLFIKKLGAGLFGTVHLAESVDICLKDLKMSSADTDTPATVMVAVKLLKGRPDKKARRALIHEAEVMSRLDHKHVLQLLTAGTDNSTPFMITEYMVHGNLQEYLHRCSVRPVAKQAARYLISYATLYNMCSQVADGMRYIASMGVLHRDLAARNCLVGYLNQVKIGDFGLAQCSRVPEELQTRFSLAFRHAAHECFQGQFSEKSDVWSFGVTAWEILTLCRAIPYAHLTCEQLVENATRGPRRELLPCPQHTCSETFYRTFLKRCWEHDSRQRPTFKELYRQLLSSGLMALQ